jgi:hypothetical protein
VRFEEALHDGSTQAVPDDGGAWRDLIDRFGEMLGVVAERVSIDVRLAERALSVPREADRMHFVSEARKVIEPVLPTPGPVPRAVLQEQGCVLRPLGRRSYDVFPHGR